MARRWFQAATAEVLYWPLKDPRLRPARGAGSLRAAGFFLISGLDLPSTHCCSQSFCRANGVRMSPAIPHCLTLERALARLADNNQLYQRRANLKGAGPRGCAHLHNAWVAARGNFLRQMMVQSRLVCQNRWR